MNRAIPVLGIWVLGYLGVSNLSALAELDPRKVMTAEEFKSGEQVLPYRLRVPDGANGKLPLVVFLHGIGERGKDNQAQLKHGVKGILEWLEESGTQAIVVAPQCAQPGSWGDVDWQSKMLRHKKEPTAQLALVLALMDELVRSRPVDPKRIYLTGLSMGGYGTWDAIWRRPEFFAAAVPICGGGLVEEAGRLSKLPLWVFHGGKDNIVPPVQSTRMVEAIRKAGGDPKYTEYEGVGHDSWTKTYGDGKVLKWMFAQKRE